MVPIINGVFLLRRPCYKNMLSYDMTSRFSLTVEQILLLPALTWLKKMMMIYVIDNSHLDR